jgi:hypothetical protein
VLCNSRVNLCSELYVLEHKLRGHFVFVAGQDCNYDNEELDDVPEQDTLQELVDKLPARHIKSSGTDGDGVTDGHSMLPLNHIIGFPRFVMPSKEVRADEVVHSAHADKMRTCSEGNGNAGKKARGKGLILYRVVVVHLHMCRSDPPSVRCAIS